MFDKLSVGTIEGMKKIADHYGPAHRYAKLAEECCELAIEAKRIEAEGMTPELHKRFVDESADVLHLLMQITRFVEPATVQGEIAKRIGYKVERQLGRMKNGRVKVKILRTRGRRKWVINGQATVLDKSAIPPYRVDYKRPWVMFIPQHGQKFYKTRRAAVKAAIKMTSN